MKMIATPLYRLLSKRSVWAALIVVFGTATVTLSKVPQRATVDAPSSDWKAYAGSNAALRYSPLDQINAGNIKNLRIVWRQSATPKAVRQGSGAPLPINYAHAPLVVGGVMYMSTGYGTVAALDASNGEVLWFDPPPTRTDAAGPDTTVIAGLGQAKRGL